MRFRAFYRDRECVPGRVQIMSVVYESGEEHAAYEQSCDGNGELLLGNVAR